MTDDTPLPFDLPSVRRKKLTVDLAVDESSMGFPVRTLSEFRVLCSCTKFTMALLAGMEEGHAEILRDGPRMHGLSG
jgi:hypothetical protein